MAVTRLFAKFDLDMPDHPKVAPLSDAAFRAFIESILWSRKHLTDGFLASRYVAARWSLEIARELVDSDDTRPLWTEVEGGYQIRDFDQHQDTKAVVEKRSQDAKRAGQAGGRAKAANTKRAASKSLSAPLSENLPETETETHIDMSDASRPTSVAAMKQRQDITEILDYLDARLEAIDWKKPARNKTNLTAVRLLIDRDGYTLDQIRAVIDYGTSGWWEGQIRSADKLREKFETLLAQMRTQNRNRQQPAAAVNQAAYRSTKEIPSDW